MQRCFLGTLWVLAALSAGDGAAWASDTAAIGTGTLDFYRGPVVSSGRAVGLGGAAIGLAETADDHLDNPASFTARAPFFGHTWYDWDFGISWFNTVGSQTDVSMSGRSRSDANASFGNAGFNFK